MASFGMLLRDSQYKGDATYDQVIYWANNARGDDEFGYRVEFVNMIRTAQQLGQ